MQADVNEHIYAWVYVPGTKVDYPILQRSTNNNFYLDHDVNGKKASCGSIYTEKYNNKDFNDNHTVIYGHNMNNGAMFADIHKYEDQAYYDSHPVIWVLTPTRNYRLEIFAGYKTGLDADAWQMFFVSDDEFMEWVDNAQEKSAFESDIIPTVDDRIVTLSTCSDSANEIRFVLLGVIRE